MQKLSYLNLGLWTNSIYHHLRRQLLGLNAYRRRYFAQTSCQEKPDSCPFLTVDWINDVNVIDLLDQTAPDLTVVMGTSILQKKLRQAAGEIILNLHGGYLPDYRGNHCFFFALYHGRFDKIGSTIHFVDSGIDTGDIVEVVTPSIEPEDFQALLAVAEVLYCRAEKMAIHRLMSWIEHEKQGGQLPRLPQIEKGTLYRRRDRQPYHDLLLWLRQFHGDWKSSVHNTLLRDRKTKAILGGSEKSIEAYGVRNGCGQK